MTYLLQRLLQFIPVLVIVSIVVFGLARLAPVDPAIVMAGGRQTSPEVLEAIREQYHLKKPVWQQYLIWAGGVLRGDFGESFRLKQDVRTMIVSRLPISLQVVGLAFLFSTLVSLPLGILAAANEGTWVDAVSSLIALIGVSTPVFFTGVVGVLIFSYTLGWLPAFGTGGFQHLILPSTALGLNMVALTSRTMRSSLLEALETDYVRTAKAKGLSGSSVLLRHGVRNAMLPVVTVLGLQIGFLLVGAVLVEYTFGLGGLGSLIVDGVQNSDYPIVQGTTIFVVIVFMAVNLLTDLLYAALDPRIHYD
jgi:peptide/nickel transport system permease protein